VIGLASPAAIAQFSSPVRSKLLTAVFLCVAGVGMGAGTCGGSSKPPKKNGDEADPAPVAARGEFRLFAFAEVLGTIAPCGCTTEPLGGLQYAFGYIEQNSTADNRLVLEPGSFLFPARDSVEWPTDEAAWVQARDRAALLHERFSRLAPALVSGLGPTDVVAPEGSKALSQYAMPRVVANVALPEGAPEIPEHEIVELRSNGLTWKVGVTAIVDPALPGADRLGKVAEPQPALKAQVEAMREAGADFTIALAQGQRPFAETLARAADVDLVIVGVVDGADRERLGAPPGNVGGAWVLEPGTQLQTVTQLKLSVEAGAKAVPALSEWSLVPPKTSLQEELGRVEARLEELEADPEADRGFIANLDAQRKKLVTQIEGEPQGKVVATLEQVKVTCRLPVDDAAKAALAGYDEKVAQNNKKRFAGVKPPPPAKGKPGYAGIEACNDCHEEAVAFWKTTVHAGAYETLVEDNKQFDLSCVSCHVTGFREPGGSEVVENAGLVDVQCETCHGPSSLHVEDGGEKAGLTKLEAPAELCATTCHTPEHSDTFDYVPYLRDILGPGHGPEARKKLGDGPTGHELRQAGLKKAGGACKKMM
jgi:hypothetical protein